MDFQYLPMRKNEEGKFESTLPEIFPDSIDTNISWLGGDAPLIVLPPLFSRIENPQNYHFRRPPQPKSGDKPVSLPPNIISKSTFILCHSTSNQLLSAIMAPLACFMQFQLQNPSSSGTVPPSYGSRQKPSAIL